MTPRERFLAALRAEPVDRVPLDLEGFEFASPDALARVEDPLARAIGERVYPQSHGWVHVPSFCNRYLVTPRQRMRRVAREERRGSVLQTTEIDTPGGPLAAVTGTTPGTYTTWTLKYPVETREDLEKIRSIPWEPPIRPAEPARLDLPTTFHERCILRTSISSPFVCVAGLMTYQSFLELCATDLPLVIELTEICRERILALLDIVLARHPIEYVWIGGSEWVTPPKASVAIYEALVQEQEREMIARVHAAGAIAHVHCHGNVRDTIGHVIDRGADYYEPVEPPPDGDMTLAEAKAFVAGQITLGGNVEPHVLENEDEAATERATRAAFEGGTARMALRAAGGPIGPCTPRMARNYHRMLDVWEELSPIP